MRIARYTSTTDHEAVGVVVDDRVVALDDLDPTLGDIPAILASGPETWRALNTAAESHTGTALVDVRLLAPIPRPSKFLAVGMNSADHVDEAKNAERSPALLEMLKAHELMQEAFPTPRFPMLFNKQLGSITGPHDDIWRPFDCPEIDYEGEAALVIGKPLRRASEEEAAAAIAGWTVTNDVTVREWQWNTSQIWLGKSFDTHAPTGPWVVTADEFDPEQAIIRTWVNGQLRQDGRLADQILGPGKIVAAISQLCSLEPGDIIATGTPAGIGSIHGRYLQVGDRVRIEVSGIGAIENEVAEEPLAREAEVSNAAEA
ncbi:MAG: hypothetical protein JWO02_1662 [Solirubrobacterales bacterium]|nr:hypothetical protein [Solirubrobacterales bacterium]